MTNKGNEKGKVAEEALRVYFQSLGFFVVRSVPFVFQNFAVTDVDLWLYMRQTPITRERINVDIKRKRTPQAIERIFWTKGVQEVLGFDSCIVATTDKRPETRDFGALHGVRVLDGNALDRIVSHYKTSVKSLTEEELLKALNVPSILDARISWSRLYLRSKQDLLVHLDFNGFNRFLNQTKQAMEEHLANEGGNQSIFRFLYISIAFLLLALDFRAQRLAYYDTESRKEALVEGFRFGEAGKQRAEQILETALSLTEHAGRKDLFTATNLKAEIDQQLTDYPAESLANYLAKSEVMNSLFETAKQFYSAALASEVTEPRNLNSDMRSIIGLLADHLNVDRKSLM